MPSLTPIRPSAPIRAKYEARIFALVDEMQTSLTHWLRAEYRRSQPEVIMLGMDRSPASILQSAMDALAKRWQDRFDEAGPRMAEYFAKSVKDRCERTLKNDLRRAGMTVRFTMTAAMQDAFDAVRNENVSLIKSIAAEHLQGVEQLVMRSVSAGRDLASLTEGLTKRYGITKRRAARIALHQNNSATATMRSVRELELGLVDGEWLHSGGGKVPDPNHVAFSRHRFKIADGHDFKDGFGPLLPGQRPGCRCTYRAIIPGFD